MITLIICAIISGAVTLYIIAPIMQSRPAHAYFLMVFIPAISLGILYTLRPSAFADLPIAKQTSPDIIYANEMEQLRDKLDVDPENAKAILDMGGAYISRELYDEAIKLLKDATAKRPENNDFTLQLATAYFTKGLKQAEGKNYDKAIKNLYRALAIAPEDAPFIADIENFIEAFEKKSESDE